MSSKRVNKKSLSYYILLVLEKTIDGYVRYDDLIHHSRQYAWGSGWDKQIKKSELSQALKRLRERGLIKEDKVDANKVIFKLTELGKDALGVDVEEKWDGKWRIVIFDIPEQKRVIRNMFRRRLKDWGFKRWQQSVWVTKRNVTKKLKMLIKDLKIEDWIAVIEADDVSIGNKMLDGRPT